jgi:hypothetical protein
VDTDDRAELAPALCELAAAFTALVQVLLDNGHAQLTPQRIVDIAARIMPGCRHAAVVIVDHHRPHTLPVPMQFPTTLMPFNSTPARVHH